jgi:hypothetical protein
MEGLIKLGIFILYTSETITTVIVVAFYCILKRIRMCSYNLKVDSWDSLFEHIT